MAEMTIREKELLIVNTALNVFRGYVHLVASEWTKEDLKILDRLRIKCEAAAKQYKLERQQADAPNIDGR